MKEIEAARGELRPTKLLAMDPKGGLPDLAGERTQEPAFGLPALWVEPSLKEEAMFRGCTIVDPPSVLTTHLTEIVRETMAELLSYAETQKLLDELPSEQQKLVADLIPSQVTVGSVQRVLQALLAERVSIRDLPTILEGVHEACGGSARAIPTIVAHVRARLARQISESHVGPAGYIPLITLSPEWEGAFAESLVGPAEDRQLAMAPSRLQEFMLRFRAAFDAATASGEAPVLLTSGGVRLHVRAIVERIRPGTSVLAQAEIFPRARIRTVDTLSFFFLLSPVIIAGASTLSTHRFFQSTIVLEAVVASGRTQACDQRSGGHCSVYPRLRCSAHRSPWAAALVS